MERRCRCVTVIVAVFFLTVVSGCSAAHHRTGAAPAYSGAVPGGAPIAVSPGSPAICSALVDAPAVRGLGGALLESGGSESGGSESGGSESGGSESGGSARPGAAGLRAGAQQLRTLSGQASGHLRTALTGAADALDKLATAGMKDQAATAAASQAVVRLGGEVQAACHFPVG